MHRTLRFQNNLIEVCFAIAWSDGYIDEEVEAPLLRQEFEHEALREDDRAQLSKYWQEPPTQEELDAILERLSDTVSNRNLGIILLFTLKKLVEADGQIEGYEEELFNYIQEELRRLNLGTKKRLRLKIRQPSTDEDEEGEDAPEEQL